MQLYPHQQIYRQADKRFRIWKQRIEHCLSSAQVEHIGSTAIRGAISKGDLDLLVAVAAEDHALAVEKLLSLGFEIKQDTHRDKDLCMLQSQSESDLALQVISRGSYYECFVVFRDCLNDNPQLVRQYNQLKQQNSTADEEQYRAAKAKFIDIVINNYADLVSQDPSQFSQMGA
jgi:GrpB-like predicted nucleotidyltransferase (UPF0157 family)